MSSVLNFSEAEKQLKSLASPGIRPGLARLSKLLSLLGNPERKFRAIHIVGTNGKGSIAASICSILTYSGYKTAIYTSPHLVSFGERLSICGKTVPVEKWLEQISKIRETIDNDVYLLKNRPTYFELTTAAAFLLIAEENTDVSVVEAGLGGRLDATNILKNIAMTVIAPIGMDHTEYLGDNLCSISSEKFAVMRRNVPSLFAGGEADVEKCFFDRAEIIGAEPYLLRNLIEWNIEGISLKGTDITIKLSDTSHSYHTALIGTYQADNAAMSIASAYLLKKEYPNINELSIKNGLSNVKWTGRFEIVSKSPLIIYDGAHNSHAMKRVAETLKYMKLDGKIDAVLAMMKDKDIDDAIKIIKSFCSTVYCTEVPDMPRSMKSEELYHKALEAGINTAVCCKEPLDALKAVIGCKRPVICCGSLYFIGWLKSHDRKL